MNEVNERTINVVGNKIGRTFFQFPNEGLLF
jgi:hypothetical protein